MTAEFAVAVHALVYLEHVGTLTPSGVLADNICTNPARVRKVMARLHHAGLVEAREGKNSGYCTLPGAAAITLRQVIEALGEEPVSSHWRSGDVDRACQICSGMAAVMDDIYARMNEDCIRTLSGITIGAITAQLVPNATAGKKENKPNGES
ncbi:MAG: Rrf2 family transcriptional regulator [Faecalibacterium sp.]|jgi:DNA-binding IscR family transcriptional regulator|nr:Rrf2 family transcriptional regulator [Faecalibacterium sp.]